MSTTNRKRHSFFRRSAGGAGGAVVAAVPASPAADRRRFSVFNHRQSGADAGATPRASAAALDRDPLDDVLRPPPDESPHQRDQRLAQEAEASRISQAIDASIKAEKQARKKKRIVRLLLLGQSESGQSVFCVLDCWLLTLSCREIHDAQA